jgi:hypothetical protein
MRLPLPVLLSPLALAAPAAAVADPTLVTTMPSATVVGAAQGWTAWSELRDGAYVLVTRAPEGTVTTPSVATRGVPFDLDLGADASGRPVAAYSRCQGEPRATGGANTIGPQWTSGRGCSIVLLDLGTGRETKVRRAASDATEVLPSIAGSRLAYVAVPKRGGTSRALLVLRDLKSGKVTRMDSGRRRAASAGFAEGPTSVDASGRTVVAAWRSRDPEFHSFDTDVRVRTLGARKPFSAAGASNSEECSYETILSPTLSGSSLLYLDTTGNDWVLARTPTTRRAPRFADSATGDDQRVPTSAAVDGSRLVVSDTKTRIGGSARGETRIIEMTVGGFASKTTVGC